MRLPPRTFAFKSISQFLKPKHCPQSPYINSIIIIISFEKRRYIALNLAEELGIAQAIDRYPHQLSGGMQQRVALGRALAIEPDFLILDEPFSSLDIGRRRQLQDLILQLLNNRNLAILLVSHDLAEAVRLGNKIIILSTSPSKIVYEWKPELGIKRDEAYIYKTVSSLLTIPQVASCFNVNSKQ